MVNFFDMEKIINLLKENVDNEYKVFLEKLIPNIPSSKILGIRKPILKKLAKEINSGAINVNKKDVNYFLDCLPHRYHEENILHCYLLMEEYDKCLLISRLEKFLPYIDNWETCDLLTPKPLLRDKILLHEKCTNWIDSDEPYIKRFAIVTEKKTLKYGIDKELFDKIVHISSQEYYINMAVAWYLQEAILYDEKLVLSVLESEFLSGDIFKFTIRKINDSFRVANTVKMLVNAIKNKIK